MADAASGRPCEGGRRGRGRPHKGHRVRKRAETSPGLQAFDGLQTEKVVRGGVVSFNRRTGEVSGHKRMSTTRPCRGVATPQARSPEVTSALFYLLYY